MKVSKAPFLAALMTGGLGLVSTAPALAQTAAAQPAPARQPEFSRAERTALLPLQEAFNAAVAARQAGQTADWTPVETALPAAQAAARGNDARILISRVQLGLATAKNNDALYVQALDALIANPVLGADELPTLLNQRVQRAFDAQDFSTAERILLRLQQLTPNDPKVVTNLAVVRNRMGNTTGALDTLLQTIQTQEASGQPAQEDLYRRAFSIAYASRDRARSIDLASRLARNYPTPANWRNAVAVYRNLANPSRTLQLDTLRFARATGGLQGQDDYLAYAQLADQAALYGEVKAVLDEAASRGAVQAGSGSVRQVLATANGRIAEERAGLEAEGRQARNAPQGRMARAVGDALYGYGRYAEAADLYRVASGKTGEDPNLLNLRLGAALAMAGQRAAAETALRAVAGEPADLAKLWLAWLGRRSS
jgi:Flp pilus assembly protein TadD